MNVYNVKWIKEADFGCEEMGRDEPMALLYLEDITKDIDTTETKYVKVAESTLAVQGIEEGKGYIIIICFLYCCLPNLSNLEFN